MKEKTSLLGQTQAWQRPVQPCVLTQRLTQQMLCKEYKERKQMQSNPTLPHSSRHCGDFLSWRLHLELDF